MLRVSSPWHKVCLLTVHAACQYIATGTRNCGAHSMLVSRLLPSVFVRCMSQDAQTSASCCGCCGWCLRVGCGCRGGVLEPPRQCSCGSAASLQHASCTLVWARTRYAGAAGQPAQQGQGREWPRGSAPRCCCRPRARRRTCESFCLLWCTLADWIVPDPLTRGVGSRGTSAASICMTCMVPVLMTAYCAHTRATSSGITVRYAGRHHGDVRCKPSVHKRGADPV